MIFIQIIIIGVLPFYKQENGSKSLTAFDEPVILVVIMFLFPMFNMFSFTYSFD